MPIAPVGFHNVSFVFRAAGATRDATFQLGIDDNSAGGPTPDQVVEACWEAFTGTGAPGDDAIFSDQWTFKGCSDAYTDEVGVIVYQHLEDVVGDVASKPVPINSAMLVRKNTALGGRRNRGRMFAPPISMDEGTVDVIGNIAPVTLAIIAGYWDTLYGYLEAADMQPVLFHNEAPFTPTPITSFTLQGTLATQRRRMRK